MAAKIDIKRSSRIKLTREGYRAERIAMVSGVSGSAESVLYNAINDAALPDIGDAHPDVSDITLNDISCEPVGGGRYQIKMSYYKDAGSTTTSSAAQSRMSSGLAVEETHTDINGKRMKTAFVTAYGLSLFRQSFTGEVERPRITIEFEYTAAGYPTADINKYLGKINSTAWNGYAVETILCSGINVDQAGTEYRVTYSFAYRPETWAFIGRTSQPPPLNVHPIDPDSKLDLATGTIPFDVYRQVDFSPLGFTLETVNNTTPMDGAEILVTGFDATLTVA